MTYLSYSYSILEVSVIYKLIRPIYARHIKVTTQSITVMTHVHAVRTYNNCEGDTAEFNSVLYFVI